MAVIFAQPPQSRSAAAWFAPRHLSVFGLIFILICIFCWWFFTSIVPIFIVEAKYQYRQSMYQLFGTESLRALLLPQFSFDLAARSRYKQYGITIPDIFLDEPVVFNVDPNNESEYTAALKQGIAHASGTSFPDAPGVGYYFAHSSSAEFQSQFNAVFYLLGKLTEGDPVYIWHEGERFDYKVTQTRITDPSDVSFLNQDESGEQIVLQTCWPPGTTQQRLLVFAERVQVTR